MKFPVVSETARLACRLSDEIVAAGVNMVRDPSRRWLRRHRGRAQTGTCDLTACAQRCETMTGSLTRKERCLFAFVPKAPIAALPARRAQRPGTLSLYPDVKRLVAAERTASALRPVN